MAKRDFERSVCLESFFHSLQQVDVLQNSSKFVKDHYISLAFQDVTFGLRSLVQGRFCAPALCFDANFLTHVDDLGQEFQRVLPSRLRRALVSCARAAAKFPEKEELFCEGFEALYAPLTPTDDEVESPLRAQPSDYLRFVLASQQEALLAVISEEPAAAARILAKTPSLFSSISYCIPEEHRWSSIEHLSEPMALAMADFLWRFANESPAVFTDVSQMVITLLNTLNEALPHSPAQTSTRNALFDLIRLKLDLSKSFAKSDCEEVQSFIRLVGKTLEAVPVPLEEQEGSVLALLELYQILLLDQQKEAPYPRTIEEEVSFVLDRLIERHGDAPLFRLRVLTLNASVSHFTTYGDEALVSSGESPAEARGWTEYFTSRALPLSEKLFTCFQESSLPPDNWDAMLELSRYASRVPLPFLPALLRAQEFALETLEL
jgi:hypothetical protein